MKLLTKNILIVALFFPAYVMAEAGIDNNEDIEAQKRHVKLMTNLDRQLAIAQKEAEIAEAKAKKKAAGSTDGKVSSHSPPKRIFPGNLTPPVSSQKIIQQKSVVSSSILRSIINGAIKVSTGTGIKTLTVGQAYPGTKLTIKKIKIDSVVLSDNSILSVW